MDLGVGGRRKPETRGAGSRTGNAVQAWQSGRLLGHPLRGLEGFGLGVGSAALLQALAALNFQLTLPPLKQGIFPERKREPAGPPLRCGSHVSHRKLGHQMRQNLTQRSVLYRANELGAFLNGEEELVCCVVFIFLIKENEK